MAKMPKTAKKSDKTKHDSVAYRVDINVLPNGNFTYTSAGHDASTLQPSNGDTVQWSLKVKGKKQPFTIEFPDFSPFGIRHRVVRSFGGPTDKLTVNVNKYYRGNLAMKYSVILTNGWSDDPDIVPVPSDGLRSSAVINPPILLSVDGTGVEISPPRIEMKAGVVTWKWNDNVDESSRDDFDLTFDNPVPPGWPATAGSNGTQQILLNLPKGGPIGYTITTENLGLEGKSTLNVL